MDSLSLLDNLRVSIYEFHLLPERELVLPRWNKANVLRGAFGWECRRLVCGPKFHNDCSDCARLQSCPYAVIFEPAPPAGAQQLRNFQDIPRPYVFHVRPDSRIMFDSKTPFLFQLVLIGSAVDHLPYFIVVFRELGTLGIGVNRGTFRLESIYGIDPVFDQRILIYSSQDQTVRNTRLELGTEHIRARLPKLPAEKITMEFLTPTKLIFQEKEVLNPAFEHIFKRLRDRISSLLYFHCGAETDESAKEQYRLLGDLGKEVRTEQSDLQRAENFRLTRRKERHPLSGFTGRITFSGNLAPFLPFLIAGEWIGVGKNTVFGNGWYRLIAAV